MSTIIIEDIPFHIRSEELFPMLNIKPGSNFADRLESLLENALRIASPKAAYMLSAVEHLDNGIVMIDSVQFQSRVMRVNLEKCRRAFPFIATCGTELEEWSGTLNDTLESFWGDTINLIALSNAVDAFKKHMKETFETGTTSCMNPGSLEDWPLLEQHKIFSLLSGACSKIGVRLNRNAMMIPLKSVSGLEFESDEKFHNCRLCSRERCPARRVPYDEHLYATRYR
jgi:hypothetical protein